MCIDKSNYFIFMKLHDYVMPFGDDFLSEFTQKVTGSNQSDLTIFGAFY